MSEKLKSYPEFNITLKHKRKASELIQVKTSTDAAHVCRMCFDADSIEWTESFIAIALNRANKAVGFYKISIGGISGTVADPRVIFQFALLSNATALIICHNHPSGNVQPSRADEALTAKIKEAGKYFDIGIIDHIILTPESYYSFADNGIL